MYDVTTQLESMNITDKHSYEDSWPECIQLLESTLVPQRMVGIDRPCVEDDYQDYRITLEDKLVKIRSMIQNFIMIKDSIKVHYFSPTFKNIRINLLLVIGEQYKLNVWNTPGAVALSHEICDSVCQLYNCNSMSQVITNFEDQLIAVLLALRPKLLKDTWKTYLSAVTCYEWIISQVEIPTLSYYIDEVLPTALIISDDFIDENRSMGINYLHIILQHCSLQKNLTAHGYANVIYDALTSLIIKEEKNNIITLYSCMAILLDTVEYFSDSTNTFGWSKRDDVLDKLLNLMEMETNSELRHKYMICLPKFLNRYGCAKWFERLARILADYCEHHTDLKTLKATLEAAKVFLVNFRLRVPSHSTILYRAFLKLHVDLMETPVFDNEIMQNLEYCICLLNEITPIVGADIMKDTRIRFLIKNNLPLMCSGDARYFN